MTGHGQVLDDIHCALDKKLHCVSVFIDLSKAFDTVNHAVLVQRLKCCGITGHALDWFINYLSNCTQCVMADGCKSIESRVHRGVLRCSARFYFGPTLVHFVYQQHWGSY